MTCWVRLARDTIACSDTVGKIATEARAKQLVLTHFRKKSDALMRELAAEVARDYTGAVILGRDLLERADLASRERHTGRHIADSV